MQGVFLDAKYLDELDLSDLHEQFTKLDIYQYSSSAEVVDRAANADVIITNKTHISADVMCKLPQLKLICVVATGVNNIDMQAAKANGVAVFNCQAYGVPSVVQHTFALMLALQTNLMNYHQAVQTGAWQSSQEFCLLGFPVTELSGKTLGIVGYGNLGQGVAKIAEAFGMKVLIAARDKQDNRSGRVPLKQLLAEVDVLTLHCPLTPETTDLIAQPELALMKPTAILINVARGGVVNESDLLNALKAGEIAAAATDVLTVEPPAQGNPLLSTTLPNLLVTPHSAWGSAEARQRIIQQTVDNIKAYRLGETSASKLI